MHSILLILLVVLTLKDNTPMHVLESFDTCLPFGQKHSPPPRDLWQAYSHPRLGHCSAAAKQRGIKIYNYYFLMKM